MLKIHFLVNLSIPWELDLWQVHHIVLGLCCELFENKHCDQNKRLGRPSDLEYIRDKRRWCILIFLFLELNEAGFDSLHGIKGLAAGVGGCQLSSNLLHFRSSNSFQAILLTATFNPIGLSFL